MSSCRSCRASIIWMKTVNGKNMPVNWTEEAQGDKVFDHKKHVSHYATCPNAAQHRKDKQQGDLFQ